MPHRFVTVMSLAAVVLLLAGCPKGNTDYSAGRKAEAIHDFDTALQYYERALKADPLNPEYKLKTTRVRFEAAQAHVDKGQKLRVKGELTLALAEFEKAMAIDPGSAVAEQEARATMAKIAEKQAAPAAPPAPAPEEAKLQEKPAELIPISREPINLKLTNDSRIVFETIAKLAGLTVIFDPDFQSRRIPTELTNVTIEQALDVVALQSKAYWKPVTQNIIFVVPDNQQKRKDYEDFMVRTFYLGNTVQAQDLTEVVTGLRQLLNIRYIQQVNAQNAIVIRDTPDKLALAEKIIRDVDKAKPEVVIQFAVLQARRDRARDLGITPGSSAVLTFTPRNPTSTSTTGGTTSTTTTPSSLRLNDLQRLSSADYSITLPGASAMALISDSTTKIIQNPEIRVVDGQEARLRVGDRVPIATGSFQAGIGVGAVPTGGQAIGGAGLVNPLVNTQFQYIDVGVNINVTPRIHSSRDVSMKVSVEVSTVSGNRIIGGIEQPVISQRKIEHDIRLKEGEVSVLGGLVEQSDTKAISGWPGLAKIPFLRYFFSGEKLDHTESEVLIVLIPRIVRLPEISAENLRGISSGTDQNIQVRSQAPILPPPPPTQPPVTRPPAEAAAPSAAPAPGAGAQVPAPTAGEAKPPAGGAGAPRILFAPQSSVLKRGDTLTISVQIENVKDLFSIPILLQYDPKVISLEEVRHGGFLGGGQQEIAIVHRIDKERGQAIISATRQPNTEGVSGSGTLLALVIKGLAPGSTSLGVVQMNARDSQQKAIPLVSGEAVIRVQ